MKNLRMLGTAISLSILSACGGSGAGDDNTTITTPIDTAGMAVEPLVGTWDLPGNWSGQSNDQAYLLIKSPGLDGVAEAIIYDYDDAETGLGLNCFRAVGLPGTANQSLSNELFLNLSTFPGAIVSLNATGDLVIVYSEDTTTSIDRETTTLIATSVAIAETDITPLCS